MNVISEIRDVLLSPYFGLFIFGAIVFAVAFLQKGRLKENQLSPATIAGVIVVFILLIAAIPTYQWVTTPREDPIPAEGGGLVAPPMGGAEGKGGGMGKGGGGMGKGGGGMGKGGMGKGGAAKSGEADKSGETEKGGDADKSKEAEKGGDPKKN